MATYASLSAEDKAVVDNFTNIMRTTAGEFARALNHMNAIAQDSNAVAIFQTLDAGEYVPNRSGLAGADSMTKAELQSVFLVFDALVTSHNTTANRNAWTKMAGIVNMIG